MADEKKPKAQQQGGEGKAQGKPQGKKAKPAKDEVTAEAASGKPARPKATNRQTARMRDRYYKDVLPALMKEFDLDNPMAAPKLEKIIVNMGVGEAGQITGQKPVITRARKSIAAFKVREGMPIGVMVTLRGDRMYEFFDRLVNVALPRVRDFRGVPTKS